MLLFFYIAKVVRTWLNVRSICYSNFRKSFNKIFNFFTINKQSRTKVGAEENFVKQTKQLKPEQAVYNTNKMLRKSKLIAKERKKVLLNNRKYKQRKPIDVFEDLETLLLNFLN